MVRLYLETNFLLCHAFGRDPATGHLMQQDWPALQVAFPTVCVMEALGALEQESRRTNAQVGSHENLCNELGRNRASPPAAHLLELLVAAEPLWGQNLQFFRDRLTEAVRWLGTSPQVECLSTSVSVLMSLSPGSEVLDPTDALILATILEDAAAHPTPTKVLVTENARCFHQNFEVRGMLAGAGIR